MIRQCKKCKTPLQHQKTSNGEILEFCSNCRTQKIIKNPTLYSNKNSSLLIISIVILSLVLLSLCIIAAIIWSKDSSAPVQSTAVTVQSNTQIAGDNKNEDLSSTPSVNTTPVFDVESKIKDIKKLYYKTQDELSLLNIYYKDEYKVYADATGEIKRIDFDGKDGTSYYYYEDSKLYFAFVLDGKKENRYYIYENTLFRWINDSKVIFDNTFEDNAYMEKYETIVLENNKIISNVFNQATQN